MKNRRHTAHTPEDILTELRSLVADAETMVGNAVTENSEEALSALRARYDAVQERLSETYADAKRKVVAGAAYADEAIRENPYRSVAVAAGAGLLVGVLLAVLLGRRGSK